MGVNTVEFRYTLTEAVIRNLCTGNVIGDLTNDVSGVVAAPIWSPNAKKVALYSRYKRDGSAAVYRLTDRLIEFPPIVIEAPIVEEIGNLRLRTRANFEEPIIWLSDDVLLIKKTGRIQIIEEPPRWVDYDYDVEVEFGNETAHVSKITPVTIEWLSE